MLYPNPSFINPVPAAMEENSTQASSDIFLNPFDSRNGRDKSKKPDNHAFRHLETELYSPDHNRAPLPIMNTQDFEEEDRMFRLASAGEGEIL